MPKAGQTRRSNPARVGAARMFKSSQPDPRTTMQLKDVLRAAIMRLEDSRVGSSRLNAEILLMHTLGCDRAYLYAHPERELIEEELTRYDEHLSERARGVPSQYITGHQEFWGLDFLV